MTYIGDSTAASNTSAAPRSASATSPTTSPGRCSKPEGSDLTYTLDSDEPYYLIVQLGLYDTLWAIILPSIGFAIPLTVLILVNFLRDVPGELFESMRLDGASDWRMLWALVVPLSKPAIITVAIYDALNVWNGFLFPLVLTQSSDKRVLPLSLWAFQGSFTVNVPAILAAVVLSVLLILAAYAVGRRQLVAGLTAGFSK